jgi:hypothetical protein
MSGFGPFYPPALQGAANPAERLSCLLARMPVAGADDVDGAWMIGRAEEVTCFVRAVVRDWRAADLAEARAARAIGAYIDVLHAGLVARLGVETLACCSLPDATARPVTCDTNTVVAPAMWPPCSPHETAPGANTLLAALDDGNRAGGLATAALHHGWMAFLLRIDTGKARKAALRAEKECLPLRRDTFLSRR